MTRKRSIQRTMALLHIVPEGTALAGFRFHLKSASLINVRTTLHLKRWRRFKVARFDVLHVEDGGTVVGALPAQRKQIGWRSSLSV
jgi:hypothetical protein